MKKNGGTLRPPITVRERPKRRNNRNDRNEQTDDTDIWTQDVLLQCEQQSGRLRIGNTHENLNMYKHEYETDHRWDGTLARELFRLTRKWSTHGPSFMQLMPATMKARHKMGKKRPHTSSY